MNQYSTLPAAAIMKDGHSTYLRNQLYSLRLYLWQFTRYSHNNFIVSKEYPWPMLQEFERFINTRASANPSHFLKSHCLIGAFRGISWIIGQIKIRSSESTSYSDLYFAATAYKENLLTKSSLCCWLKQTDAFEQTKSVSSFIVWQCRQPFMDNLADTLTQKDHFNTRLHHLQR